MDFGIDIRQNKGEKNLSVQKVREFFSGPQFCE
jgi:hypothetical protein